MPEASFEMKGDNLIFLVTIPIHDGSNKGPGTSKQTYTYPWVVKAEL